MEQQSSPRAGQACLRGESPTTAALDYVDCYLIHTPFAFRPGDEQDPRDERGQVIYDSGVTLVETWRALERLVDDGQCKSIGLSDITLEKLQEIVAAARIKPAVVEVESHPYHPQWELLDFCRQHGIVLLAFAALGHGMRPKLLENPVITTIAQRVAEMYASLRTTARVPSKGMPQAPCPARRASPDYSFSQRAPCGALGHAFARAIHRRRPRDYHVQHRLRRAASVHAADRVHSAAIGQVTAEPNGFEGGARGDQLKQRHTPLPT
jgi:hypothetical protein